MSTAGVNLLNIGLMLGSLALALAIPFELFLAAYAVLGPLHYLTEISWLHDRRYFAGGGRDALALIAVAVLLTLGTPLVMGAYAVAPLTRWNSALVFFAFALALVFVLTDRPGARAAGAAAALGLAALVVGSRAGDLWFGLMLPTLVHVLVFTGVFILTGAIRERSRTAYASLAVFVGCAAACLLLPHAGGEVADAIRRIYPMGDLNCRLVELLRLSPPEPGARPGTILYPFARIDSVFESGASLRATQLIAFAYTYHYLNWFSKTRVIGWHEIPRARMAVIAVAWAASVALYAVDYRAGLAWLLLLSLGHVFLEFPLNWRSFAIVASAARGAGARGAGARGTRVVPR